MEGMKSDAFMFIELQRILAARGINLATQDINDPKDASFVLCVDNALAMQNISKQLGQHYYLLLSEPATYHPHNYLPKYQHIFDKIFTYDYTKVDNRRIFPYRFAIDFESYPPFENVSAVEFAQRRLCTLVAASFGVSPPKAGSGSLLHERYRLLRWFSENHPDEFDFYCRNLDMRELESIRGASVLRKILPKSFFTWLGQRRQRIFNRVYRGALPPNGKISQLRNYRFAIAYENTGDVPGYITEKPFDCFAAAVVPVYLGDPLVQNTIPPACFIDRRKFASDQELYNYLSQMSYEEYSSYIIAIGNYLDSPSARELTSEANAQRIAQVLLHDLHTKL
jgi:hypothetical protein